MRHFRLISTVGAAVALVAIAAGTALASSSVSFTGTFTGKVTEKVDGQNVTALASGAGTGTLVGKSKLTGTVTATTANPPCSPLSGPGSISGPKGKLKITVVNSRGCAAGEDDQDNITLSGTAKVTGGTLKFKKARATLHFSGHYDRKSGAFNVKLTGKLTY